MAGKETALLSDSAWPREGFCYYFSCPVHGGTLPGSRSGQAGLRLEEGRGSLGLAPLPL